MYWRAKQWGLSPRFRWRLRLCILQHELLVLFKCISTGAYVEIVLKMWNPSTAVLMMAPGIWGCQCASFTSCWGWKNSSWGGTSSWPILDVWFTMSSSSCSTAKSHKETRSSAADARKTESSVGCHSIEVIGARCQSKDAAGDADLETFVEKT